jgi:transposase InsO family protein
LSSLCALLGYSRQAFYGFENHHAKQALEEDLIIQQVITHRSLQTKIGTRKLIIMMQDFIKQHQIKLGRDALFDLLRDHSLLVRKRRRKVQTTFSKHRFKKYKNLIRDFEPLAPNLLWVSDITYLRVGDSFAYLSLITDAYSKQIMGFSLSKTLQAKSCIKALQMALSNCNDTSRLIHHSDRGVQYCSTDYTEILDSNNIQISMTENGDPLENAIAERVNGILKTELLQEAYRHFEYARTGVAKAIMIYNSLRPHSSCEMLTPLNAHQKEGRLKKHWKNYYKKKEVEMPGP